MLSQTFKNQRFQYKNRLACVQYQVQEKVKFYEIFSEHWYTHGKKQNSKIANHK